MAFLDKGRTFWLIGEGLHLGGRRRVLNLEDMSGFVRKEIERARKSVRGRQTGGGGGGSGLTLLLCFYLFVFQ